MTKWMENCVFRYQLFLVMFRGSHERILTNRAFVHNNWATKPQIRRQPNFRGFFFSSFPFSSLSFIFIHRPNQIFFIKSCYQISLWEFLTGERDNAWPLTLAPPHYHFSSFFRPSTLVVSHHFLFITYLNGWFLCWDPHTSSIMDRFTINKKAQLWGARFPLLLLGP